MEYSEDTVHSIRLCINTVGVKCVFLLLNQKYNFKELY